MRNLKTKIGTSFDLPSITGQIETQTIEVEVRFNDLLKEYAEVYANNVIWNMLNISDEDALVVRENMHAYLKTLVAIRCNTTGRKASRLPSWLRGKRYFAIPPFVNLLVQHVGYVHEPAEGLEIFPATVEEDSFLEETTFLLIERVLRACPNNEYSTEFPTSKQGDWTTMSICVIENQVLGKSLDIPGVHAVIGAFLNVSGLENVLNPRITYGHTNFFRTFISKLAEVS